MKLEIFGGTFVFYSGREGSATSAAATEFNDKQRMERWQFQ